MGVSPRFCFGLGIFLYLSSAKDVFIMLLIVIEFGGGGFRGFYQPAGLFKCPETGGKTPNITLHQIPDQQLV